MLLAVQHTVQLFANLVVASTMGLSLAIGVAGAFNQRFPLECASCQGATSSQLMASGRRNGLVLASTR